MKKYTIGVDVGGTNIKLGIINSSGSIVARGRLSTKKFARTKIKMINAVVQSIEELIDEHQLTRKQIQGIGLGLPGLVDPSKGIVYYLPNIPGWRNVALSKIIQSRLKIPVYIDNDVNVITLAEWKYGAGVGCQNLMCITLGTGIGGGLIFNNEIYRGEGFVAGEIGHFPLEGKVLEFYIGNKSLQFKAGKIFKNKNITLEEVYELAKADNTRAIEFWYNIGTSLGTILAGVVNVLNPRLIIIGGGVSNNFKFLGPAIRDTIQQRAMKVQAKMVKVVRAKLGDDAGILGAQILVKDA